MNGKTVLGVVLLAALPGSLLVGCATDEVPAGTSATPVADQSVGTWITQSPGSAEAGEMDPDEDEDLESQLPTDEEFLDVVRNPESHVGEEVVMFAETVKVEGDEVPDVVYARVTNRCITVDGFGEVVADAVITPGANVDSSDWASMESELVIEVRASIDGTTTYRGHTLPHLVADEVGVWGSIYE